MKIHAVLTTLLLSAPLGQIAMSAPAPRVTPDDERPLPDACRVIPGWGAISAANPRFVVFGEMHGTNESPAFVGNLACLLAKQGRKVLVAVEIDSASDGNLQTAWESPPDSFETSALRAGWNGQNAGNTSMAMLRMLSRLHALKSSGLKISVVAFAGIKTEDQHKKFDTLTGQEPGEAASAENIADAARGGFDQILVLTGNVHAGKKPFERGGSSFRPMAMFLERYGKVVSLDMITAGGTGWGCALKPGATPDPTGKITSDMLSCGPQRIPGDAEFREPLNMGLGAPAGQSLDASYDGYYWVGKTSSSPPAIPTP